jgi:chitinase
VSKPSALRTSNPAFLLLGPVITALFLLPSCGMPSSNGGGNAPCAAVPSAPTGLAASSTTSTGTTLTWNASTVRGTCTILGYAVHQGQEQIAIASTTTYNVTGLSPATTYTFTVLAGDGDGVSLPSTAITVTTAAD